MTGQGNKKKTLSPISHAVYIVCFSLFASVCVFLQCADISVIGVRPDITFALICAIGFVLGEAYGSIFGLCAGLLIMYLGSSGISFSPVMYTLCGYFCGVLPKFIFRRNFLSYLIYSAIMGGVHVIFTVIYYFLVSQSFEIWLVIARKIIPDFLITSVCMIPMYFLIFGIYTLFKGKDKERTD